MDILLLGGMGNWMVARLLIDGSSWDWEKNLDQYDIDNTNQ
jgi:hypothetical protein